MRRVFFAPRAMLFEFQPRFYFFDISGRPIIDAVAIGAFKFNKIVLAHNSADFISNT